MIDKELLEILACPKCKSEVKLNEAAQRIICMSPQLRSSLSNPGCHSGHAD